MDHKILNNAISNLRKPTLSVFLFNLFTNVCYIIYSFKLLFITLNIVPLHLTNSIT